MNIRLASHEEALIGYLTSADMAEQLGLHPTTLAKWRMARRGPPYVKIGKRVYYRVTSVREWLENAEVKPVRSASSR
ncbi:helix-turn-helix domain-containing protein [Devosia neptuniae]|uniref:helix-turn-helix domain-containing protein n=1 Tax=Devosia neptuniae TaxID=191302 RepID=UPI0034DD2870